MTHVVVGTADGETLAAFYCAAFGFEADPVPDTSLPPDSLPPDSLRPDSRPTADGPARRWRLRLGSFRLELVERADRSESPGATRRLCDHGIVHLALHTIDYDAAFGQAVRQGWRPHAEPILTRDGGRAMYGRDPDGNVVELISAELSAGHHLCWPGDRLVDYDHSAISTPDRARLSAFYQQVFGFEFVKELTIPTGTESADRITGLEGAAWCHEVLANASARLEIFQFESPVPEPASEHAAVGFVCLGLDVEDLAGTRRLLAEMGIADLDDGVATGHGSNEELRVCDPDGNVLTVSQRTSAAN